jgi:hypothetical protein
LFIAQLKSTTMITTVLAAALTITTLAQAQPRAPQGSDTGAQQISRAWAALAQGRTDEAIGIAQPLIGSVDVGHEAAALIIRAEASRDGVKPALAAYEAWLGQSARDDRFLLHPVALHLLTSLATSNDPAIRAAAAARLAGAGLPAPADANDRSAAAVTARAEAGDRVAQQQLADQVAADPESVRAGTVKALAAGGAASVQQLTGLLKHRAPDVRAAAVDGLGQIGGGQAIAALQQARNDNDPYVRLRVTVALARAGDQDALAAANTALSSPVADIRVTAAEAFADHPTEASQAALRSALSDPNPLTRARAASLLPPSDETSTALTGLLASENPTVREETARIAEDRLRENISVIRGLLASTDPWQQLYGAGALLARPAR